MSHCTRPLNRTNWMRGCNSHAVFLATALGLLQRNPLLSEAALIGRSNRLSTRTQILAGGRCQHFSSVAANQLTIRLSSPSATAHSRKGSIASRSMSGSSANNASTPAPPLVDVDCNLWHKDLVSLLPATTDGGNGNDDPWQILSEDAIEDANIVAMLSPSSTIQEAQAGLLKLQQSKPPLEIRTTVGVHPYHVRDDDLLHDPSGGMTIDDHVHTVMKRILTDEANAPWCAAVGECGLDASEGFPPIDDQIPWFRKQVELAEELQLPLFVHERLAFEQTMDVLKTTTVPVIIHCFTGTQDQCRQYIDRGYFVSVSGFILKENADNCDEVRKCLSEGILPLERLMIETDSPYMGFTNCRQWYVEHNQELISSALNSKKRKRLVQSMYPNVPTSLLGVLDKVVECLQQHDQSITKDQVAAATTANAKSFFGFKFGE